MWMKMNVPECDFTNKKYSPPVEGAGMVARGATGRWCVVMYCGPENLATQEDATIMTEDEVRDYIEKNHPGDWLDY